MSGLDDTPVDPLGPIPSEEEHRLEGNQPFVHQIAVDEPGTTRAVLHENLSGGAHVNSP